MYLWTTIAAPRPFVRDVHCSSGNTKRIRLSPAAPRGSPLQFGQEKEVFSRCSFPCLKNVWIIFLPNIPQQSFPKVVFLFPFGGRFPETFPKFNLPSLELFTKPSPQQSYPPNVFQPIHQVGGEVFFSSNWPDRTYVSAYLPSLEAERLRILFASLFGVRKVGPKTHGESLFYNGGGGILRGQTLAESVIEETVFFFHFFFRIGCVEKLMQFDLISQNFQNGLELIGTFPNRTNRTNFR